MKRLLMFLLCAFLASISFSEIRKGNNAAFSIVNSSNDAKYDAEVEWLESTGSEYIVFPLEFHAGKIRIEGRAISVLDTTEVNPIRWYIGSGFNSISDDGIYLGFRYAQVYYDKVGRYTNLQGSKASISYDDGFILEYNTESYDLYRWRRNGDLNMFFEQTYNTEPWNRYMPIFNITQFILFGGRSDGEEAYPARIYRMKFIVNDEVIYDFVSVRKNGVGYMYDKVSGQMFGNQGVGNFIIGPDKE